MGVGHSHATDCSPADRKQLLESWLPGIELSVTQERLAGRSSLVEKSSTRSIGVNNEKPRMVTCDSSGSDRDSLH